MKLNQMSGRFEKFSFNVDKNQLIIISRGEWQFIECELEDSTIIHNCYGLVHLIIIIANESALGNKIIVDKLKCELLELQ